MKLSILKDVKIKGEIVKKGSIVEVSDDEGNCLIASARAEAPRKPKKENEEQIEAPKDEPKKGKK